MIAAEVISALSERRQTVAVAESLTGGLVCATLVEVPGASVAVRGGVVAYATELKHRLLAVDAALLAARGPVDPDVAAQMALGVRERLGADWGLSTTGVAGPGAQDGVPPGRVYVAVAGPLVSAAAGAGPAVPGVELAVRPEGRTGVRVLELNLSGDRAAVRAGATAQVLAALRAALREGDTLESFGSRTAEAGEAQSIGKMGGNGDVVHSIDDNVGTFGAGVEHVRPTRR